MTIHDRLSKLEDIQYNIDLYEKRVSEEMPTIYTQLGRQAVSRWDRERDINIKCLAYWKRRFNRELKGLGYNEEKYDPTQIDNLWVEGIDHKDAPDFCDAYIERADYYGVKMTEEQLEELGYDFVYETLIAQIH